MGSPHCRASLRGSSTGRRWPSRHICGAGERPGRRRHDDRGALRLLRRRDHDCWHGNARMVSLRGHDRRQRGHRARDGARRAAHGRLDQVAVQRQRVPGRGAVQADRGRAARGGRRAPALAHFRGGRRRARRRDHGRAVREQERARGDRGRPRRRLQRRRGRGLPRGRALHVPGQGQAHGLHGRVQRGRGRPGPLRAARGRKPGHVQGPSGFCRGLFSIGRTAPLIPAYCFAIP